MAARCFAKVMGTVSGVLLESAGGTAMILPLLMGILIPRIAIHWVMAIPALVCLSVCHYSPEPGAAATTMIIAIVG
jgi:hypothetical protein